MNAFEEYITPVIETFKQNGRPLTIYEKLLCRIVWDFQQAKIDRLMFEYCPDEMTPEQIKQFEAHQQCVTS